jgi:hypothetical protein
MQKGQYRVSRRKDRDRIVYKYAIRTVGIMLAQTKPKYKRKQTSHDTQLHLFECKCLNNVPKHKRKGKRGQGGGRREEGGGL